MFVANDKLVISLVLLMIIFCVFQCIVVTVGAAGFVTEASFDYVTFQDRYNPSGDTFYQLS